MACWQMMEPNSSTYRLRRMAPRLNLGEEPHKTFIFSQHNSPEETKYSRPGKYDLNQSKTVPEILTHVWRLSLRRSRSTVSKAALRYRRTTIDILLVSKTILMSLRRVVSVLCLAQKPK